MSNQLVFFFIGKRTREIEISLLPFAPGNLVSLDKFSLLVHADGCLDAYNMLAGAFVTESTEYRGKDDLECVNQVYVSFLHDVSVLVSYSIHSF